MLAGIVGASVQGRVALGHRAGALVRRLGDARDTEAVTSRGPRQAHLEGFDLHAVGARPGGLERLARYILRPPLAQERLRLRSDGRIALELKTAWHDGTRELVFEPLELLERLAAMTPRPETNLLICHGVLAPRGVVTLCILSSNTWNLEVVSIADATPWATVATRTTFFAAERMASVSSASGSICQGAHGSTWVASRRPHLMSPRTTHDPTPSRSAAWFSVSRGVARISS